MRHKLAGYTLFGVFMFLPAVAAGHCDTLDGPVVKAAERALATGNVNHALAWVQKEGEPDVRAAFMKTVTVRKLSVEAKELSDRYFFETLVRIHRAGEGEPYTGLKPAGQDVGPAIRAVDKSIAGGSAEPVLNLLREAVRHGVERRLAAATGAPVSDDDVEGRRRQVRAYVAFLHYVERLYEVASSRQEDDGSHAPRPILDHADLEVRSSQSPAHGGNEPRSVP